MLAITVKVSNIATWGSKLESVNGQSSCYGCLILYVSFKTLMGLTKWCCMNWK